MEVDNPYPWQAMLPGSAETVCFTVLGARFECPPRYKLIRAIGQGAYGIVCSAEDRRTGEKVAIKKIAGIVENVIDCRRTLREIRLMRHFNHDNIIAIKDVYIPASNGPQFQDVYTVTELMDTDLHQIISSNQGLTDQHCQYFTYQILRALKYIHSANVLHRDLKPSNILLNGNCDLKVCDFGLARGSPDEQRNLTAYVATRWYRAPELLLSYRDYTRAVDIWSVGCILAEILRRSPLFPGRDTMNQLHLVTEVTGTPSATDLESIHSGESGRVYVQNNLMNRPPRSMQELFPNTSDLLRDLLGKMLVFNPANRITVDEALRHPYLSSLHDPEDEPLCHAQFNFDLEEGANPSRDTLRRMIWEETQVYRQRDAQMYGVREQY
eukprot:GFKZ01010648.1.p1 GENE.GFKZ01010648.1~~GFKZ01010648.1.p1  ORF type:complete len:382 (-),score=37.03 GFKZ01010648.1:865-2010(-)